MSCISSLPSDITNIVVIGDDRLPDLTTYGVGKKLGREKKQT